jgi:hypothetical protein
MIAIDQGTPVEPGVYLFRGNIDNNRDLYYRPIRFLTVAQVDATYKNLSFGSYMGIQVFNGGAWHNITKLKGKFSKRLIVNEEGFEEA